MNEVMSDIGNHQNCSVEVQACELTVVYVGNVVLTPLICLTGIVFNTINLFIFTRTTFHMKDSLLLSLKCLTFTDFMAVAFALPIGFIRCFPSTDVTFQYILNIYEVYIFLPFNNMFGTSSVWITLIVATERYIHVVHPILAKNIFDQLNSRRAMIIILVFAIIFNFPLFFSVKVTKHGIETTPFGNGNGYLQYQWVRTFLAKIIPIVWVAMVNFLLIRSIWVDRKIRKSVVVPVAKQMERQQSQNRITAMLLSITCVFIVCNSLEPFGHSQLCPHVFGQCASVDGTCAVVRVIANNLEFIAFTSNFISYCIFNKQFVQVLVANCCCRGLACSHSTSQHSWDTTNEHM